MRKIPTQKKSHRIQKFMPKIQNQVMWVRKTPPHSENSDRIQLFSVNTEKKERHLNRWTEGVVAPVCVFVCEDFLTNKFVDDVRQVGHNEEGDHCQGEVGGFQRGPADKSEIKRKNNISRYFGIWEIQTCPKDGNCVFRFNTIWFQSR